MARMKKECTECGKDFQGTAKSEVCSGACRVKKKRRLDKEKKGGKKHPATKKSTSSKKEVMIVQDLNKGTNGVKDLSKPSPKTNYVTKATPPAGMSKSDTLKWFRNNK